MLDESWKDLTRLRVYKGEYELLSAVLQHYEGSVYIQNWYVADLLMGCRRVLEFNKPT